MRQRVIICLAGLLAAGTVLADDAPPEGMRVVHSGTAIAGQAVTDYYPLILARQLGETDVAQWLAQWREHPDADTGKRLAGFKECLEKSAMTSANGIRLALEFFDLPGPAEKEFALALADQSFIRAKAELAQAGVGSGAALQLLECVRRLRAPLYNDHRWKSVQTYCELEIAFDDPSNIKVWHAKNLNCIMLECEGKYKDAFLANQKLLDETTEDIRKQIPAKITELEMRRGITAFEAQDYDKAIPLLEGLIKTETNLDRKKQYFTNLITIYLKTDNREAAHDTLQRLYEVSQPPAQSQP